MDELRCEINGGLAGGLVELNLIGTDTWRDLITDTVYHDLEATVTLPPYGCLWISNR